MPTAARKAAALRALPCRRCLAAVCDLRAAGAGRLSGARADPRIESPGWYSARIGQLHRHGALGRHDRDAGRQGVQRAGSARLKALLARDGLGLTVPMSVNAFVIDSGQRIVMVDAGTGALAHVRRRPRQGAPNLRAAGYAPEQIDEIYLTHMHADHVGG
jgi:hypothetical protein